MALRKPFRTFWYRVGTERAVLAVLPFALTFPSTGPGKLEVREGVELIGSRPLSAARAGTAPEVEDAEEGHTAFVLRFEHEPFECPACAVAAAHVRVERLLDGRHGMRESDIATALDDHERGHLPWMEETKLLHREVVANRFVRNA